MCIILVKVDSASSAPNVGDDSNRPMSGVKLWQIGIIAAVLEF